MNNKLTVDDLNSKIVDEQYVIHHTKSGQILRWCVITVDNGFAVVGKHSACVDPLNDDPSIGESIARENTINKLWELEGYLLKSKLKGE